MSNYEEEVVRNVEVKPITVAGMKAIKGVLQKDLDIEFDNDSGRPPVIVLTIHPKGKIIVGRSENEFDPKNSINSIFDPQYFNQNRKFTAIISATFITGIGSGITSVEIGGESLTDIWPW